MKRVGILIIFLLVVCTVKLCASNLTNEDKRICDSVMQIADRMPMDTTRIVYLRKVCRNQKNQRWTIALLDSARQLSRKLKASDLELNILYDMCMYYSSVSDLQKMKSCLAELKSASYKVKKYYRYFKAWEELLGTESSLGNIEAVTLAATQMKNEADSLNYLPGTIISALVVGENLSKAHQYEKSLEFNTNLLKQYPLSHRQRLAVYRRIFVANNHLYRMDEAAEALGKALEELNKDGSLDSIAYRETFVSLQHSYCQLYLAIPITKKMKEHLDIVAKYYSDDLPLNTRINYHTYWGGYYYLVNDMPNCYLEYDIAAELGKNLRSTFMISVHELKAKCAFARKDYEVSAKAYREAIKLCFSINQDIARNNKEAVQASFKIKKALLEHEADRKIFNTAKVGVGVLLIIALLTLLGYIIHANRVLIRSARQTREAWKQVDDANRMKDIFLRNINEEIKGPIDTVVECAGILSLSKELSQERRLEYSERIKQHAGRLIRLVNNVLDLSRLEAGMMKFSIQEYDLVMLCAEAKSMLELKPENSWTQIFSTEVATLPAKVDRAWFCRVLTFVLSAPEGCREKREVPYRLTVIEGFARIEICVPSAKLQASGSSERISHDIVRLYLETAGGAYHIADGKAVITYPV